MIRRSSDHAAGTPAARGYRPETSAGSTATGLAARGGDTPRIRRNERRSVTRGLPGSTSYHPGMAVVAIVALVLLVLVLLAVVILYLVRR